MLLFNLFYHAVLILFYGRNLLLLCALAISIVPTTTVAEDLLQIYQQARIYDPIYQREIENWQTEKIALPLARSAFMPKLGVQGTRSRQRDDITGDKLTQDTDQVAINVGLSIYNKSNFISLNQAKLRVTMAELQFRAAEHDLILRVAERYFNVLAMQDNYKVTEIQKNSIGRQMNLARERLDVGLGTKTDLYDARARYQQAESDLIKAKSGVDNSIQALQELLSGQITELASLNSAAPLTPPDPNTIETWIERALKNNLSLTAQKQNETVSKLEISQQKAARWPRLDAKIEQTWRESNSQPSPLGTNNHSILSGGLTLTFPIYSGGTISNLTRQARHKFNAQEYVTKSLHRKTISLTTSAYLEIINGISQIKALNEAVKASSNALKAKEEGFNAGLSTNLAVLNAQRDLSRLKTDRLVARYNYILSTLRLKKIVGDLGEADIQMVNSWLKSHKTD